LKKLKGGKKINRHVEKGGGWESICSAKGASFFSKGERTVPSQNPKGGHQIVAKKERVILLERREMKPLLGGEGGAKLSKKKGGEKGK